MNREDLAKQLEEKNDLIKKTEMIYQQLQGQIVLLRDLIKKEDIKKENIEVIKES